MKPIIFVVLILVSSLAVAADLMTDFGSDEQIYEYLENPEALVDAMCSYVNGKVQHYDVSFGVIKDPIPGASIHAYCGDDEVFMINSRIGSQEMFYADSLPACETRIDVRYEYEGSVIEPVSVEKCADKVYMYKYDTAEAPVFGAVGGLLAGAGSLAVYLKRRRN